MKIKYLLLICASALLVMGCTPKQNSNKPDDGEQTQPGGGEQGGDGDQGGGGQGGGGNQDPVKVIVPAHKISDSNPPFDLNTPGEKVSESTWNSFKNGGASKFNNHFNYSYTAFHAANNYQQHFFTKNGYGYEALQGGTFPIFITKEKVDRHSINIQMYLMVG